MKKGHKVEGSENRVPLVPTKAALFGLDLRFRAIDEQLAQKKNRRRSMAMANSNNTTAYELLEEGGNRHLFPSQTVIDTLKFKERKREHFKAGTCYDNMITERLQT